MINSKTISANENFLFPSKLPEAALFGWKKDKEATLWVLGQDENDEIIKKLKELDLVSRNQIKEVKLVYKAATKNTHIAEIQIAFEDPYSCM